MLAAAVLPGGCGPAAGPVVPIATRHPVRVMSLSQCTDQLVLALLPPARIASVTWLSRDPAGSLMAPAAMRVDQNHGLAEEVLAQKPDLVVAGTFTTPALRGMLKRLGYPLLEVEHATSIDDVRRTTRQVAAAVGERARGEALIGRMDARLAVLARDPGPPIRVVAWDRTGFAAGSGTLYDAILRAAGARNLMPAPTTLRGRSADVEALIQADPTLIVQGSGRPGSPGLGDDVARHRVVRRLWGNRILPIAQGYYACGTPMIADAAVALRRELRRAAKRVGSSVPAGTLLP